MAWTNLSQTISAIRRSLTADGGTALPASASVLESNVLAALLAKVRGNEWTDVDQFFAQYGGQSGVTAAHVQAGVTAFLDDLAGCLLRMEGAGRFAGSRSSEPARSYFDYFLLELRLADHYNWATQGALRGRFNRLLQAASAQAGAEAAQSRIARLEQRWVTHWLEYFRTSGNRFSEERRTLWRFILLNWSDFAGDASRLGSRATPAGWGVSRDPGTLWYESLDSVDNLLVPGDRTLAETRAVSARGAGAGDGFWIDIFNRHHQNYFMLFVQGMAYQQNIGAQLAGTGVADQAHRDAIAQATASSQTALQTTIPHWHMLRDSLMQRHEVRFLALRQCYYRYWSLNNPAPRGSSHLEAAGIYIAISGSWSVRPMDWAGISGASGTRASARSSSSGCASPGRPRVRTAITARQDVC